MDYFAHPLYIFNLPVLHLHRPTYCSPRDSCRGAICCYVYYMLSRRCECCKCSRVSPNVQ